MKQKPKAPNKNLQLTCKKQLHCNYYIEFFSFSTNKDELLQCIFCSEQFNKNVKKISLTQLYDAHPWQISNFPPVDDDEQGSKIRKQLKKFPIHEIMRRKQEIYQIIDNLYIQQKQKFLKVLESQRKETISIFNKIYQDYEIFDQLDTNLLKQKVEQFYQEKISLDCLFEFQQNMKNEFKCSEKIEKIFQSQQMFEQMDAKLDDLKLQLNVQFKDFEKNDTHQSKQTYEIESLKVQNQKLTLENEKKEESVQNLAKQVSMLKIENQNLIQQIQIKASDAEQKALHINKLKLEIQQKQNLQQDELKLVKSPFQLNNQQISRNQNQPPKFTNSKKSAKSAKSFEVTKPIPFKFIQNLIETDEMFNNPIYQYQQQFLFYKSQFDTEILDEITILGNPQSLVKTISFDAKTIKKVKQVWSQFITRRYVHHFKVKINLNGDNKQQIGFYISDYNKRDDLYQENGIIITNQNGQCISSNGSDSEQLGYMFSQFMKDDQTIFNIVIDFSRNSFEIYDDNHKCYVKNKIKKFAINQQLLLGIQFIQNSEKNGTISFLGYSRYEL